MSQNFANVVINSHTLRVIPQTKQVFLDDETVEITGLTFKLLMAFLRSEGQTLTADRVADSVWGKSHVSYEAFAQRVSILRKLLKDDGRSFIESVRGHGYQWLPSVEQCSLEQNPPSQTKKPIFAAAIVIALLCSLYWIARGTPSETQEQVNRVHDTASSPLLLRAASYANQKNETGNKLAIQLYSQHLSASPVDYEVQFKLTALQLEQIAKFNGESELFDTIGNAIDELKQQSGIPSWRLLWLEGYYHDVSGRINAAISYYEMALSESDISNTQVTGSLAYLYAVKGRLYEALSLNVSTLEGNGYYRYLQVAEVLYLAGLNEQAQDWLTAARSLAPDDNFSSIFNAKYQLVNGQLEEAAKSLKMLHELDTKTSASLTFEAILAMKNGQNELAEQKLDEAMSFGNASVLAAPLYIWVSGDSSTYSTEVSALNSDETDVWPNVYVANSIKAISQNNREAAMQQLVLAQRSGFLDYQFLQALPPFEGYRRDQRYIDIIESMKRSAEAERLKISLVTLPDVSELVPVIQ